MSDAPQADAGNGRAAASDVQPQTGKSIGISRRTFLKGAGVGVAAVGLTAYSRSPVLAATASPDPSVDPLRAADLVETWAEPRVWRPIGSEPLTHHVVENTNGFRFSYDGVSPGPTIRMRGDETLYVKIENELSRDAGESVIGPSPDPAPGYPGPEGAMWVQMEQKRLAKLLRGEGDDRYGNGPSQIPTEPRPDWSLSEHLNGLHSAHVTNMHTHGLHVASGKNDNGTHSDDIFLRIVPMEDAIKIAKDPELYQEYQEIREEIIDNVADFEFRLGNVMEGLVGRDGRVIRGLSHPPGTHWYHPHSHGATQFQVASGMAGFLIVEGDVDDLINERIAGDSDANWDQKTGDWDYREREFFLQRVIRTTTANIGGPAAGPDPDDLKKGKLVAIEPLVNGDADPDVILMRPGAIERWRVLNGSVDGVGFMRLAVLEGHFDVDSKDILQKIDYSGGTRSETPVTINDYAPLSVKVDGEDEPVVKARLWQLAWDGVTLMVEESPGSWVYRVKDLATVNDGQEPDLDSLDDCYKAGNVALCYNRPNEMAMADANRADVFFQAPRLDDDTEAVYTVVALPISVHGTPESTTKVLAHVVVRGDAVPGDPDYPFADLLSGLDVSPYELPVSDEELEITTGDERAARDIGDGPFYRTRVVRYAGWGSGGFPMIEANPEYVAANPDKERLSYYSPPPKDSVDYVLPVSNDDPPETANVTQIERFPSGELPTILLPPKTKTMSIDGEKFFPTSESTPRMLLNTSEEWAVYNQAVELYSIAAPDSSWTDEQKREYISKNEELFYYQFKYVEDPPTGAPSSPQLYYRGYQFSYPMTPAQVKDVNAKRDSAGGEPWAVKGQLEKVTRAVDHPFHIHQNPFWLMRIEVPDEDGNLVNILAEPRWADVVWIPRNGGRVVFRSRFVDFEGEYVNHCHILIHEDNGMMQRVTIVGNPADTNYEPRQAVVHPDATEDDVNAIYDKPSVADSWKQSLLFVDGNNTGQVYPGDGFQVEVPTPPTE
jgi:FtsP/CotA-like multicopper oxidase with cupredoxin domain